MKYSVLAKKFKDQALKIEESGSTSATYRARSYERVAAKILAVNSNDTVTEDGINELGLSDYMTGVATDLLNGKNMKKVRKCKIKRKTTIKRKVTVGKPKPLTTEQSGALIKQLVGFMGIGKVQAQSLIDDGLTKINQLHMKKWLTKLPVETRLYLELKPTQAIPRANITAIKKTLKCAYDITIVGSYRRGKPTSRDIDVMLVSRDVDVIEKYLKKLKKKLTVYPYSQGKDKMSLIVDCTKDTGLIYKLDVFRVEPVNKIPMMLYATGSKEFNIRMRSIAKAKGYLLNQKGLFKKQPNGETRRVSGLNSESDYFEKLSMEYLEPDKR